MPLQRRAPQDERHGTSSAQLQQRLAQQQEEAQEAPYLTHLTRHHGQYTLTAPPNLGARRHSDNPTSADDVSTTTTLTTDGAVRLSGYASVHRASSEAALTELAKSDATNAELSNTPRTAQAQEAAPPRGAETRKKPGAKRRAKSKPRKRAGGGVDPSILDAVMNAGLASGRAQQTAASAVLAGGDNASIYSANSLASTSSSERVLLPPPPQSSSSSLASARTPTPTGRPRTPVQLAPSAENATEASTSAAPAAASLEVPASDTPARPSSRSRSPRRMRRQRSAQSQEERGESASQPAAPSRQDTRGDTIDLQEARERMARIYDAQGDDPALPLPSTPPPEFEASPPPDDRREPSASYRHAVPLLFADDFPGALRPRSATRSRGERALAEVVLPQESLMGEATMRRPRSTSDASTSSAGSGSGSSAHAADDDEDEKVVRQLLRDAWEADRAAGLSISVRIKRDAARRHADVAQMPESEWESAPRSTDDLAAGQEAMWARVAQQRRSSEQSSTTPGPPSAQNDGGASGVAPQPSLAEGPATDSEEDEDEVITPVAQRPSAAAREEMARAAERRRQAIAESMRALEGGERRTAASQTSAGEITPTGTSMVNLSPSRSRSPVLRRTAPPAPASEDSGESESEDEDAAPSQPPPRITEAQTRPDRSSSGASAAGVEDSADERAARAQRRLSRAVSITARRRRLAETADQRMAHVTSVSQAAPEDAVIAEESESATPPLGAGDGSIEQGRIERRPLQQHTRAPPPPVPPSRILRTSSINSTNSRVGPPARSPPPPPPALSRNSSLTRPPPNPSILSYIPHSDRAGLTEPLVPSTVSLPVSSSSSPPQPRRPPPPPPPARSSSLRTSRPLPPQPFPSERPDSFTWMNTLQRQRQRQEQETAEPQVGVLIPDVPLSGSEGGTTAPQDQSQSEGGEQGPRVGNEQAQQRQRDYTDLDLLLLRLERQDTPASYDDLLLLSEIIGPVNPTRSTDHEVSTLASAPVFCECRRVDKRGRIKSKLSVVGIRCVECAICLLRMREHQMGTVFPGCLHVFHTKCIERWLTQSRFCPTCRAPIDGAASTGERTTP